MPLTRSSLHGHLPTRVFVNLHVMRRSASSHNIDVSVAVEVTRNQILDGDTAIINDQLLSI